MAKLSTCGAEAWPVSHAGRDGRRSLETIVVMSEHADGRGAVHLTADQALYVQSRLSQIAVTFLLTIGATECTPIARQPRTRTVRQFTHWRRAERRRGL